MAFSYLITSTNSTIAAIAAVRLAIGDTVENEGVLPGNANFSDEEIAWYLDEADDDHDAAVLAMVAALARRWATVADITVGPRRESLSQISARWQALAEEMRDSSDAGGGSFTFTPQRDDGYADYADS